MDIRRLSTLSLYSFTPHFLKFLAFPLFLLILYTRSSEFRVYSSLHTANRPRCSPTSNSWRATLSLNSHHSLHFVFMSRTELRAQAAVHTQSFTYTYETTFPWAAPASGVGCRTTQSISTYRALSNSRPVDVITLGIRRPQFIR